MSVSLGKPVKSLQEYQDKQAELSAYLTGHWLTDFSNFSSFVFHSVPDLNWAGFYLFNGDKLLLGPFVGKPACTEIKIGRGVCGTAFEKKEALLVPNVDHFPGHIACDSASRSELVLPFAEGVFDLDSPSLNRFQDFDREGLQLWLDVLTKKLPKFSGKYPWA